MGLKLLEKTELWINNVTLEKANLTDIATVAAGVLGLPPDKVLVVDVRPENITLDILSEDITIQAIVGKENALLEALKSISGVHITEETCIHSNGILGLICLEEQDGEELTQQVNTMVSVMQERIARRAIVFPTGFELHQGLIEDTNTPYLKRLLEDAGYAVTIGSIIEDDIHDIENKISDALSRAFGLIITTGGVGAEDKDKTVEGILRVDSEAITPYIMKFTQGTGRHMKDGVRIALGSVGPSLIVALPGPNDEVRVGATALLDCLKRGLGKEDCAHAIASSLARKLKEKQTSSSSSSHHHNKDMLHRKHNHKLGI